MIVQGRYRKLRESVGVGSKNAVRMRSSNVVSIRLGVERSDRGKERPGGRSSRSNKRSSMRIQSGLEVVSSMGRNVTIRLA